MYRITLSREQLHALCTLAAWGVAKAEELSIPYLIASRKLGATQWDRERMFTAKDYDALLEIICLGAEDSELSEVELTTFEMFRNLEPEGR